MPSDGGSSDSGSGSGTSGGYGSGSGSGGGFSSYSGGGGYTSYSNPGESATITPSAVQTVASQYAAYGEGRAIAEANTSDSGSSGISESGGLRASNSVGNLFSQLYSGAGTVRNTAVLLGPTPPLAKAQAAYNLYNSIDFNGLNIGFDKPRRAWNGDAIGDSPYYGSSGGLDSGFLSRIADRSSDTARAITAPISGAVDSGSGAIDSAGESVYTRATDTVTTSSAETKSGWTLSNILATIASVVSIYGAFKK